MDTKSEWTDQEWTDSLSKLDEWYPPQTPSLESIQQLVIVQSKERRRLLIRDLSLFLLLSIMVISIVLFSLMQSIIVYAGLQVVCLLSCTLFMVIRLRKQKDKKRVDLL